MYVRRHAVMYVSIHALHGAAVSSAYSTITDADGLRADSEEHRIPMETLPLWKLPTENTCVDTSKAVAQGLPRRGAAELVRYAAAGTEKLHASSKGQWGLSADREAQLLDLWGEGQHTVRAHADVEKNDISRAFEALGMTEQSRRNGKL